MNSFIYQSAATLARLIREGKASSTEIVTQHLARIKEHNDKLNALISIFEKEALATAAQCDQEAAAGNFRGPLHGVPITIKECFWIKGEKSNTNFKMLRDFVAPEDAVIVDRILKSGAIILGQTNVPKNLLDYQVAGDLYPEGKNPFNTEYTPGGSTGGGAAALAAGFSPLELGSDFGGSIRVPANFCGLYGLKPTENTVPHHGNMPLHKGAKTFIIHMAQAGPLARNPEDLELLWNIIVGPHESDRNIPRIDWKPAAKTAMSEYKIAWTDGWPGYETSSQTAETVSKLIQQLQAKGCSAEKRIPDESLHRDSLKLYVSLFPYVIAQGTPWFIRKLIIIQLRNSLLKGMKDRELQKGMLKAFRMNANHYAEAMLQKSLITRRWENFFRDYDFLICPVAFGPAYKRCKIGSTLHYEGKEIIYNNYVWPYTACFNASGNPSVAIPLGIGKEGIPLGIQIVGPYWSEPELLSFAKLMAGEMSGFIKPDTY
jgi:amidase